MGFTFGLLNGLFTPNWLLMVLAPIGCGIIAGTWKAVRGLNPSEHAVRIEMIAEGQEVFSLSQVPMLEGLWQCIYAYGATGLTVFVRYVLS